MDGLEVLRSIIAPILSVILSITTVTILVFSYFLVFRIKRYINKSKFFLNYIKKLNRTINKTELCSGHMHRDDISGSDLDKNKKMIYEILTKFKSTDLKDIIIGTYKEELSNVSKMINYNYRAMNKNANFLKFQRLFHVYYKGTTRLLFLDNNYISFYKIHRRYVEIGMIEKSAVERFSKNFTKENLSIYYEQELHKSATIYNLYFYRKSFAFKNVINPKPELEDKLNAIKPFYHEAIKTRNKNFNVYLCKNFDQLLNVNAGSLGLIVDSDLLLEPIMSAEKEWLIEEARQIKEIHELKKQAKRKNTQTQKQSKNNNI